MKENFAEIIKAIGEDLDRPGLQDTPARAAKAFEYLTRGYHQKLDEVINNALFPSDSSEMIVVKDIELYSMCEHHLLPFIGRAHVAYIPTGKVLGLSKIARIVDMYARRLQIQEQLTTQIAETIMEVVDAAGGYKEHQQIVAGWPEGDAARLVKGRRHAPAPSGLPWTAN